MCLRKLSLLDLNCYVVFFFIEIWMSFCNDSIDRVNVSIVGTRNISVPTDLNWTTGMYFSASCPVILCHGSTGGLMIDTFYRRVVLSYEWKMPLQKKKKKLHSDLRGSPGTSNQVKLDISVPDVWSCQPKALQIADPVIWMQGLDCMLGDKLGWLRPRLARQTSH